MAVTGTRSKIRWRLFAYFACLTLLVALMVYLTVFLSLVPSLQRTAYEAMSDSARAQMAAVDQSVRALNSVSVAITYSPRVRGYMEQLNASGRLSNEQLQDLIDQLATINGPMLPAAQVRLYAQSPVMVAMGMVNGQFNYDSAALEWYDEVERADGAKVLSLPKKDGALIKANSYIALRRVLKKGYYQPLGVVEVVADSANLLKGAAGGEAAQVFIINKDGALVYPAGGTMPQRVRDAIPNDGFSGILEIEDDLVAWRHSTECDWTLAAVRERADVMQPISDMTRVTLGALSALLAVALALSYLVSRQFTRPIHALAERMQGFSLLEVAPSQGRRATSRPDELTALNDQFDELAGRLNRSVDELILIKQQELQSHMMALQSQMNPHFLYNTLSNLGALIEMGDSERAVMMIEHISRMLRYISADDEGTVRLEAEIAHLDDYIECMRLRYGSNLAATIYVDDEALALSVPKLSIQPLVENAIKYGCTTPPPWHITVDVRATGGGWLASVTDDGAGFDHNSLTALRDGIERIRQMGVLPSMKIGGMGLLNIAMRLKLYAGDGFLFHIQNLDGSGSCVTIGCERGGSIK